MSRLGRLKGGTASLKRLHVGDSKSFSLNFNYVDTSSRTTSRRRRRRRRRHRPVSVPDDWTTATVMTEATTTNCVCVQAELDI